MSVYDAIAPAIITTLAGFSIGLLVAERFSKDAQEIVPAITFGIATGLYLFGVFF